MSILVACEDEQPDLSKMSRQELLGKITHIWLQKKANNDKLREMAETI